LATAPTTSGLAGSQCRRHRRHPCPKTRTELPTKVDKPLYGDWVLGPEPAAREDFQWRLEVIARAIANPAADWRYEMQLRQFKDVADRIGLQAGNEREC